MSAPPLSDELAEEAVDAYRAAGFNESAAATNLGLPRTTLHARLRTAARRGLLLDTKPAMPGFRIAQVTTLPDGKQSIQQKPEHGDKFEVPPGMRLKGVTALTDADGRIMHMHQMARERTGGPDPLEIAATLKAAFTDFAPAASPVTAPLAASADLLTLLPSNDWHLGMFAWGKEVGENWDLKIAEETIGNAVDETILRSPSSGQCIVLGGGDLLHADNKENQTAKSGNALDVDGRYQKVIEAASRLMVRSVEACLRRHEHVIVRILPGNHDEHSAIAIAYFLLAWYRNEPRITVDVDPSLFFWFRFGSVLLGATHGHTVKIKDMAGIMAHRRAEDWGASRYRYVHGFHLHHTAKFATEGSGVVSEIHQAPIPQDAWHFGSGFLSGRSIQTITYHREFGEISRSRTAILDAGKEAAA